LTFEPVQALFERDLFLCHAAQSTSGHAHILGVLLNLRRPHGIMEITWHHSNLLT
jgi:hypothetical protein